VLSLAVAEVIAALPGLEKVSFGCTVGNDTHISSRWPRERSAPSSTKTCVRFNKKYIRKEVSASTALLCMKESTWSRNELYEKVWDRPVTKVAQDYGVSDVAIAKVCRKLKIPLPGRGYWAKKQYGYSVSRKPLPKLKEAIVVTRNVPCPMPLNAPPASQHPEDQAEFERIDKLAADGAFTFTISTKALRHPSIVKTRQALRDGHTDDRKIRRPAFRSAALNLRVGKDNIRRGLEVLASIIARAEAQGAEVVVAQSEGCSQTQFLAFGQSVSFSVFETAHRRFPKTPPAQSHGKYVPIPTFGDKPVEIIRLAS
jgi:hypothetical protein